VLPILAAGVLAFVALALAARIAGAAIHVLIATIALSLRASATLRILLTSLALTRLLLSAAVSGLILVALSLIRVVLIRHLFLLWPSNGRGKKQQASYLPSPTIATSLMRRQSKDA
jgi:hypothetical protein